MGSRAEQKRALREQRAAREREQQQREQRKRRLWLLGASGAVALVAVGIAIAISQSGSSGSGSEGLGAGEQVAGAASTAKLLDGIPQKGTLLGDPDAPLRMVEFADLQCPFCMHYTRDVLPTLIRDYVRPGKLAIDLRLLTFIGTDSEYAAGAAVAAARENRMWQFTDVFYKNQGQENTGYVTPDFLRSIADASGVNPDAAVKGSQDDLDSPILTSAATEAEQAGLQSTPSFLIGKPGGELTEFNPGALDPGTFTAELDDRLGTGSER